ncbi:hypothetical protein BKP64_05720 [Marinobacter salinus]|uniref:Integrase catalytic domain-containing protein n=1 Tax=Marinobacter salinus TaxID=1874317 RepID=A0A1D9GJD0_9GAMM|nr:hypothetical protein [Marinobacter salinus]AOY87709.1 hypothetical protein BKP64_05720 [Marinobacter salinus]
MSWRERLIKEPGLADIQQWPVIELGALPKEHRALYLRNRRVVARILEGNTVKDVSAELGLSSGRISQLMERCLGGELEDPASMSVGLIPHRRLIKASRAAELPTLAHPKGAPFAFQALLEQLPEVKRQLDEAILAAVRRKPRSQRLTPQRFHQQFLHLLAETHWPADLYPYTSESQGYESARRYLNQQREVLQAHSRGRKRFTAHTKTDCSKRALSAIQIDEHILDLHTGLVIDFNDQLIDLRLSRCSLLLSVDVATECVLGFLVVPTQHPNQQDLLNLMELSLTKQRLPTIATPGFEPLSMPAFPAQLTPTPALGVGTVQLDNAWMHHSTAVMDVLCRQLGATISYGLPAQPKTRALVERTFDYIERHLGHRVDSTSGSYPTDPNRESNQNARQPPALKFQSLVEALHLVFAASNHTPRPHLGGATPMALFREHLARLWVPLNIEHDGETGSLFSLTKKVPVHRLQKEQREPYVQFCYCRYTGKGLLSLPPEEKWIVITYDHRDIRTVAAHTCLGSSLGTLSAPHSWLRFPHSMATRNLLFKRKKRHRFSHNDPLTGYFTELLSQPRSPSNASQLLRLYLEMTRSGREVLQFGEQSKTDLSEVETPWDLDNRKEFTWSPIGYSGDKGRS